MYITPSAKQPEKTFSIETPVGELEWVMISGEGKLNDLNGDYEYVATVIVEADVAEAFKAEVEAFYKENKPKATKLKSIGFYPHKVKTGEKDEDDNDIMEETGKTAIRFSTKTVYPDGQTKVIKVFNKNGAEVSLGSKKIGNGSRGRLKGMGSLYHNKPTKETGISNYLSAVQLTKFVEYVGGDSFDQVDDDEGDFEGFDDSMTPVEEATEETTSKAKPRL